MKIQIIALALAALTLTACEATVTRTPAPPTEDGAGGFGPDEVIAPPPPAACFTCSDALAGAAGKGDICEDTDQLINNLGDCSDDACLDPCDDNLFHTLADPENRDACLACLQTHCATDLGACEGS